jgi:hypothetical protein
MSQDRILYAAGAVVIIAAVAAILYFAGVF